MAPLVLLHLALMIVAIQGGLDSAEILARTQGSLWWGSIYSLFVVAVAIHAAIGLRVILQEWLGLRGTILNSLGLGLLVLLLFAGLRAVIAVVL